MPAPPCRVTADGQTHAKARRQTWARDPHAILATQSASTASGSSLEETTIRDQPPIALRSPAGAQDRPRAGRYPWGYDLRRAATREPIGRGLHPPGCLDRRPRPHARRPRPRTRPPAAPAAPHARRARARAPRRLVHRRLSDRSPSTRTATNHLDSCQTQMHHWCNTRHSLCTLYICLRAGSGARARKRSVTRTHPRAPRGSPYGARRTSSDSPTRGRKRRRRSG